jgi:hypothetical protein
LLYDAAYIPNKRGRASPPLALEEEAPTRIDPPNKDGYAGNKCLVITDELYQMEVGVKAPLVNSQIFLTAAY